MKSKKILRIENWIIIGSFIIIVLLAFIQFWANGTPVIRVDEGFNVLLNNIILENGQIPNHVDQYNGGQIQNYYPIYLINMFNLSLIGGEIAPFLYLFNIFIIFSLIILFFVYSKVSKSIYASLFLIFSSIIVYQIFYVHANYYPAFLCLLLATVSINYLIRYKETRDKKYLIISSVIYSVLPMIHFFNFFLFSIYLLLIVLIENKINIKSKIKLLLAYAIPVAIISGRYIFFTAYYKLKFSEPLSFVPKQSITFFNLIFPGGIILLSILGIFSLIKTKKYKILIPSIVFLLWYLSSYTSIYIFANYRVLMVLALLLPLILENLIHNMNEKGVKILIIFYIVITGIIAYSTVETNYTIGELNEISYYFEQNNISNVTVLSYYRLNTWLPTLINESKVPFANTDIYYTNYDTRKKVEEIFMDVSLKEKWKIANELGIDYFIFLKQRGIQDESLYKGVGRLLYDPTGQMFREIETNKLYIYQTMYTNN